MNNKMIFYPPRICGEEDADTFVASLGTVSLVDLDNDGREDIVSGAPGASYTRLKMLERIRNLYSCQLVRLKRNQEF